MNTSAFCYAMGYLTVLAAFWLMTRRRRLTTEGVFSLMAAGLIGGLVCANLAQWLFAGTAGKSVLGSGRGG